MDKKYCMKDRLLRTEGLFNPLMQYSFVIQDLLRGESGCPNCGYRSHVDEFSECCPYCGTSYNIEFTENKSAEQRYARKKAREPGRFVLPLLLSLTAAILMSVYIIRLTGRTFGTFDILKGVLIGICVGLICFCAIYIAGNSYFSAKAERAYRDQKQMIREFEAKLIEKGLSLSRFYNNLVSELNAWLFDDQHTVARDVVDWDVLEYLNYEIRDEKGNERVEIKARLRLIRMNKGRLRSEQVITKITMNPNPTVEDRLHPGINIIHCRCCGSPVDVTKPKCISCGTPLRYYQPLYIDNLSMHKTGTDRDI